MTGNDVWELFPYPTLAGGKFTNGSLMQVHSDCRSCPSRVCATDDRADPGDTRLCRYGFAYARIDDARFVVGLASSDSASMTSRARRRLRNEPQRRASSAQIRSAIAHARELGAGVIDDRELLRDEVLARLEKDPGMHAELAKSVRRDFEKNVQQSHDFLQLAKLVQGHAEALLAEKHPGIPPHEAAGKSQIEGAIYFSTQLMVLKLDALVFLQDSHRANENLHKFGIHQIVLKYARIYQWQAEQKDLTLRIEGVCHATATYNRAAIGAVLQGILDNLVKYAPAGSSATILLDDKVDTVEITFNSLGPLIEADEKKRIFLAGFRGVAARKFEPTGQGIGLATAHQVSDALDLGLTFDQADEEAKRFPGRYSTTFRISLRKNVDKSG